MFLAGAVNIYIGMLKWGVPTGYRVVVYVWFGLVLCTMGAMHFLVGQTHHHTDVGYKAIDSVNVDGSEENRGGGCSLGVALSDLWLLMPVCTVDTPPLSCRKQKSHARRPLEPQLVGTGLGLQADQGPLPAIVGGVAIVYSSWQTLF